MTLIGSKPFSFEKNSLFNFNYLKLNLLFVCFYCLVDLQCHCSYKVCFSKIHCLLWCKKIDHKQMRQTSSFCHQLVEFEYQSITKHKLICALSLIKNGVCFIGSCHVSCGGITEPFPVTLQVSDYFL